MKKYRKFREQKEQTRTPKKIIYTVIIAGIMIFSVIGFAATQSSKQSQKYNDLNFKLEGQKWATKIDGQKFSFYYLPYEVEYIRSDNIDTLKNARMVYLTFDPNQKYLQIIDLMRFELANDFSNINIYTVQSVTSTSGLYNLPTITCSNATQFTPVMEFRESNKTEVINQDNCIILKAPSDQEFIKVKDLISYKILGVIE